MLTVVKTFTFEAGTTSQHIWDLLFERKETYLPLLSQDITTYDELLIKVKTFSLEYANSGKLLTKFTENIADPNTLVIKIIFLDEASWIEYATAINAEFGYNPTIPLTIAGVVTESISFNTDHEISELTVYNPTL